MKEVIIRSPEMRLRLIDLEYDDLPQEVLINEINRIYIEEYREELPGEIEVFSSTSADSLKNDTSGYDGTAIHFFSTELGIDEIYIISQGTQDTKDWEYNLKAMLAGLDVRQAEAADKFTKEAKRQFGVTASTPLIALSHSLGHNNNATANLLFDTFDKVYSFNGAQTDFYQLFNNDDVFFEFVSNEFRLENREDIYSIDPDKLKSFAKEFYADKAENIYQIISEDDPLYAISVVRGFFMLGEVELVDTNPEYPGLRSIMKGIPDEAVRDLQELAIEYTLATETGNMNDGLREITGIDIDLINDVDTKKMKKTQTAMV